MNPGSLEDCYNLVDDDCDGLVDSEDVEDCGVKTWERIFGGSTHDEAAAVQQTTEGGYIVAGYTRSYGAGYEDAWLIKTDADGNELWNRTYGNEFPDEAKSVQQTTDGGYILAGYTNILNPSGLLNTQFALLKTDGDGNAQWSQTYGGEEIDSAASVQQTADGGYVIAGTTRSFGAGGQDFWLIKTDASGSEEWNQTFGGLEKDVAYAVTQAADGGYIVAGTTSSFGAGEVGDLWLVKTDANGNEQWNRTVGSPYRAFAYSVQQTTDGGYIAAGWVSLIPYGVHNAWLVKTDALGNVPTVEFPDPNLEQLIRDEIGKPAGDILASDLVGITVLSAGNQNISDITGLEYCINLEGLGLDGNEIVDASPLAGLTNLSRLHLEDNQIVDVSALAGLTNLGWLVLGSNQIVDLSPLAGLTNVYRLELEDNEIVDVSPLAGLTGLKYLYLSYNQVVDVSPLADLTNLEVIGLESNQIVDMCPLVDNPGLAGPGHLLRLQENPLDTRSCTVCIPELEARGVYVDHDCP